MHQVPESHKIAGGPIVSCAMQMWEAMAVVPLASFWVQECSDKSMSGCEERMLLQLNPRVFDDVKDTLYLLDE